MALSDERLDAMRQADEGALNFVTLRQFRAVARAIEAEVRKDDEALIRQMLEALVQSNATLWEEDDDPARPAHAAITAARARLLESDLEKLTKSGKTAWAGVDPQNLREGGAL